MNDWLEIPFISAFGGLLVIWNTNRVVIYDYFIVEFFIFLVCRLANECDSRVYSCVHGQCIMRRNNSFGRNLRPLVGLVSSLVGGGQLKHCEKTFRK